MDLQIWIPAVWSAFRARALTRSARDVLLTLRTFRGAGGLIYPSHARLAERVGCCERTVRSALADARDAGLVDWNSGSRRRTSNRYTLLLPTGPILPRPLRRIARLAARATRALVGNRRREGENSFKRGLTGGHVPEPHPPVRTVAEQLAALMRPTSEAERQEARASLAAIATRRAAERETVWRARTIVLGPIGPFGPTSVREGILLARARQFD